jgi:predicted O-linked N-acetylglucosamine transferase (SPINDLY family)
MEPENAQEHYSEQLVRLPNIGLCYPKPVIEQQSKTRSDFQLRDDAIVYLSCQSLFKYLPQYDWIFAAIAQQVSQAQFAFISFPSIELNRKFQQRLQHAFAKFGLKSEDYCVILLRQKPVDYFNLNLVSDVYLDTLSWSGGNSTMEAIACNLPIVTCPGEFMRGRHSYAILKMLGVTDTIAHDEAEYIEVAVRLGLDREWRDNIIKQMVQRHSYLFDDKTCVEALDTFISSIVVGAS